MGRPHDDVMYEYRVFLFGKRSDEAAARQHAEHLANWLTEGGKNGFKLVFCEDSVGLMHYVMERGSTPKE